MHAKHWVESYSEELLKKNMCVYHDKEEFNNVLIAT